MLNPQEAIDRINRVFGSHAHHRALHARGNFYAGTFTATPEATALCRSEIFAGGQVPVLVRWSNGSGNPDRPDKAQDVRGMAVKFQGSDGDADLLGQTAPRFPVRTPEDFVSLTEAARRPATFPLWVLRHPATAPALIANARANALGPPYSYAEVTYYPVHAYGWVAEDGARSWVRYVFTPLAEPDDRPTGEFAGFERLKDELAARLEQGPVRYDVRVTVAAPGDDPHDPTSVWRGEREISAGVIEVSRGLSDPEQGGGPVVFDPTRVVDGIELSDDPILRYRPTAYSESIERRASS
jgi:catalase